MIITDITQIDNMAEEKGSLLVTIWQFVKFIVVSLLAMIVQFVLLNTLNLIPAINDLYTQEFNWLFFAYPVAVGHTKAGRSPESYPPISHRLFEASPAQWRDPILQGHR